MRCVNNIRSLRSSARIDVIEAPLEDRSEYLQLILAAVPSSEGVRSIVFLDPDTGLESRNPGPEHMLTSELAAIWAVLPVGDILACYQHQTNRNGLPWIQAKLAQFERAIRLPSGTLRTARAPQMARDVVLFFCQKNATVARLTRVPSFAPACLPTVVAHRQEHVRELTCRGRDFR